MCMCMHVCVQMSTLVCDILSAYLAGSTSPNSEEKPSSPFDISKIHKVFDDPNIYNNLSPTRSPKHSQDMTANRYSRHSSRRNSANEDLEPEGRTIPVSSGGHGAMTHGNSSSLILATKSMGQRGADPGQDSGNAGQGGSESGHESENPLDKVVLSSVKETQHESTVPEVKVQMESNGHPQVSNESQVEEVERRENGRQSTEEDRLLEFEGESESEPYTSSSVSLDEFREGSSTSLPSSHPGVGAREQATSAAVDVVAHESDCLSVSELERDRVVHSSSVPTQAPLLGREEREEGMRRRKFEEVEKGGSAVEEGGRRWSGSRSQRRLPTIPADSQETTVKVCVFHLPQLQMNCPSSSVGLIQYFSFVHVLYMYLLSALTEHVQFLCAYSMYIQCTCTCI